MGLRRARKKVEARANNDDEGQDSGLRTRQEKELHMIMHHAGETSNEVELRFLDAFHHMDE